MAERKEYLDKVSRIVIKVGTNVLMGNDGVQRSTPDMAIIQSLVQQIVSLVNIGKEVILVSSGAIGFGASEMNITLPIKEVSERQACAAIGQPLLMDAYRAMFHSFGRHCAQLLLTRNDFVHTRSYEALRNCIEVLLFQKVIPIINENDSVAVEEIGIHFGDNDNLSAHVATKTNAHMLVILTDVDALYNKNPKKNADAQVIREIRNAKEYKEKYDRESHHETGSTLGTGGISTKLQAASHALESNCITVIGNAVRPNILADIFIGKDVATYFLS